MSKVLTTSPHPDRYGAVIRYNIVEQLPRKTTLALMWVFVLSSIIPNPAFSSYTNEIIERKSCKTSSDCHNPHKECRDGYCHCLPFYDDVHEVTSGFEDICMKSYLSSCSEVELCNVYKNLVCDEERTCVCHNKSTSVYDPFLETCVAIPGETCDLINFAGPVITACGRNAECKRDPGRVDDAPFFGKCECSNGHVESGRRCVPEIGSLCEFDADCDRVGMICGNGTCQCNEERIYDEAERECKIKSGEKCNPWNEDEVGRCVQDSSCRPMDPGEWICKCNLGHHGVKNGTCSNKCEETDEMKIFDQKRGRCSLKVGGNCTTKGPNQCVSHAFCGTGNKCQCFVGYRVTENKLCEKEEVEIEEITTATQKGMNHRNETPSETSAAGSKGLSVFGIIAIATLLLSVIVVCILWIGRRNQNLILKVRAVGNFSLSRAVRE